ncbi:serine/threonine-protein phosphatase 2A regulatory subunit B'' subunit beta isoform X4 [Aethina tumida]|uniref:serine/threonine-protein phosphatase 2A regulatory subunit B'' subunit beta isoform X4 n=1 Tax=Aethina tumida TaxID=116153 RepID=UPI002147B679|nr:serine/threonine-protein phosphatase 2A regulatory subunit B'' subunit beta isoform X4 [Aethina tumida]
MATTARRRDPEDDIAAIAKQISDQAEAIYQNWKSRGLAPADLISCHAAGDTSKLGSMLKPQPPAKPSIELLAQAPTMDNNRLKKLVKNFVDEDKARVAARNSPKPSSIQYALQKFEQGSTQPDGFVRKPMATPGLKKTVPVYGKEAFQQNNTHQVNIEEKRLLNALKNGDVVHETGPSTVMPSQLQQPKKEPVEKDAPTKWGLRATTRRPEQTVPHPELTTSQRQHLRQTSANPVRPFLTRGSVAERVLIFERCPSDLLLDKRGRAPATQLSKPQPLPKQPALQHTTLQRQVRAHRNVNIPRFHFPAGKPGPPGQLEAVRVRVATAFGKIGERASREHFGAIATACQLPLYWKTPLCLAACADKSSCTMDQFMTFWQAMATTCHDAASRFVYILTRGRRVWLAPEDFIPLVQDVVETHPGLTFLKEATEFHSRYVHTVIARIYYCVNRSWSGKITIPELRRSNLLNTIQLLEDEEDINQITQYFSYEHFYVIYCKFWELDRDHDLFIDKQDLTRHNDHALSSRIIDRIFSGCVTRGSKLQKEEKMSYTDFVWFLLSEEDKLHPTAIEYWFRCMDLDGDGFLSMYELEYFYEEQMNRMEAIGIETLPFQDCLCQMLDMVKPKMQGKITLSDLKKCKMTPIFFDTFFNLEKYLDHEQRDPFASQRDHDIDGQEMSDWDRYAAEEYELLVAEEGGNDQQDSISFDEGNEDDLLSQHLDVALDEDAGDLTDESDECSI